MESLIAHCVLNEITAPVVLKNCQGCSVCIAAEMSLIGACEFPCIRNWILGYTLCLGIGSCNFRQN